MTRNLINKFKNKKTNKSKDKLGIKYKGMTYIQNLSDALRKLVLKYDDNIKIGYSLDSKVNLITQQTYEKIKTEN